METVENLKQQLLNFDETALANWSEKIDFLFEQQLTTWELAGNHYQALGTIEKRTIPFKDFQIDLQHNQHRARNTCADVSKTAIENRPCFLCAHNLPEEQKGLVISKHYLLLVNPFPIFNRHLTIADFQHSKQNISSRITDLLEIAKLINNFTIFYNGPQCGASAPDHFHFQAVPKGVLPIDAEIEHLKKQESKAIFLSEKLSLFTIEAYLRTVFVIESASANEIETIFHETLKQLPYHEASGEPMINLLANYQQGIYRLMLFPRKTQRPVCFYKDGDQQIFVSPASVEMGGLIITPREEDFMKITKTDLVDIFREVSLEVNKF